MNTKNTAKMRQIILISQNKDYKLSLLRDLRVEKLLPTSFGQTIFIAG